jgi:hypothetical protein
MAADAPDRAANEPPAALRDDGDDLSGAPTAPATGEQPAAPAAWDPAPAIGAARTNGNANGNGNGTSLAGSDGGSNGSAQATPAPAEPLSGGVPMQAEPAGTPIFDTVSMWFTADGSPPPGADRVIDLRDAPVDRRAPVSAARWSALGDQRWLATNARAAAGPEVSGTTEVGLPRRRPGANLIPSAAAAAPVTTAAARPEAPARRAPSGSRADLPGRADADAVRGRLSSYQRGLTSARRARHLPADRSGDGLFATSRSGENDPGRSPGEQGG